MPVPDAVQTFGYGLLGGVFFGLYPSQIKTKDVLRVAPHPIVFQIYKTACVFFSGFLFLLPRIFGIVDAVPGGEHNFVFSWWGLISAFFWIPAGLLTISSIQRVGMSMVVAVSSASNAIISFTIFTVIGINHMRLHDCGHDCRFFLAPLWLCTTIIGILIMVLPQKIVRACRRQCLQKQKCDAIYDPVHASEVENESDADPGNGDTLALNEAGILTCDGEDHVDSEDDSHETSRLTEKRIETMEVIVLPSDNPVHVIYDGDVYKYVIGNAFAVAAGFLSSAQFFAITLGQYYEEYKVNCSSTLKSPFLISVRNITECPWTVKEQFRKSGSWYASFGIGAFLVTLAYFLSFVAWRMCHRENHPIPSMHWDVLKFAGIKAGIFWTLGNVFTTLAVARGGNAIVIPQVLSFTLMTSGGYGMYVYGEGSTREERIVWSVGASVSLISIILLGMEKV